MNQIEHQMDQIQALLERNIITTKEVLTVEEAAMYAGCEEVTVRKWCGKGILKFSKPGGKTIYIKRTDLEKYLTSKSSRTNEELDQMASDIIYKNKNKLKTL